MSRIGKRAIAVPKGVTVTLNGQTIAVKGPKGELSLTAVDEVEIKQDGDVLQVSPRGETARHKSMWGLTRTLLANNVKGVTEGFESSLDLVGVGYRAAMKGTTLELA